MPQTIATVLLDFDSTLISCESLEQMILAKNCDQACVAQIQKLTNDAMSGTLPFQQALEQRLKMFSLTKNDIFAFSQKVCHYLTAGMKELIHDLQQEKIDVWILSGAIREVILPVGKYLGIAESKIHGVTLKWSNDGTSAEVDTTTAFSRSKAEGAKALSNQWAKPIIAVGDGMTDFALYEAGIATHFIAYTQHVRRASVVAKETLEARSIEELRECLFSHILKIN